MILIKKTDYIEIYKTDKELIVFDDCRNVIGILKYIDNVIYNVNIIDCDTVDLSEIAEFVKERRYIE